MSFSDVGTEWYSRPKSIINGRADLIKQRRQETDDPFADDETPPWLRCALSHTSLEGPSAQVVCDAKGHLMLKEDLLVALLNKRVPPHLGLRSLREVFQCNLRRSKDGSILCPVTGDELRCCKSAQVLRPCGCVICGAAAALRTDQCEVCGQPVQDFVQLGADRRRERSPRR
ncbi:unnamed protein product, partial [Effrenium voratum]